MIALRVALVLAKEVARTLLVPFRLLGYLPRRHRWRALADEILGEAASAPPADPSVELRAFLERARPPRGERPHLFLSAGEASGEAHAANLLRQLPAGLRVSAFGGGALQQAGAQVRFQLSEHAVMGVFGVLRQLPLIVRAFADFLRLLRDDPPDLVVLVDYPGLHLVMAKACKRAKVPVLHYVAPQYWAWGPWRMRRYRRAVDATLTILPFEVAFFRRFDVPASYIGHPLLDELATFPPEPSAVAAVRQSRTLVLMPGSRRKEIQGNLPGLLRVAAALRARDPAMRVVLPHKNRKRTPLLRELLADHAATWVEHHEGDLGPFLAGAHMVLAKSGTGSLEACLHRAPTIVVYRLHGLLSSLGYHNILSVPYIAAANLIAGRRIVPEHCFAGERGWDRVLADAERLWSDPTARATMHADLDELHTRLGRPGASARVAAILRQFLFPPAAR